MATIQSVPVTITPEAARFIDDLGLRDELEKMLEHTRHAVPDLRNIEVTYEVDPSGEIPTSIVIWSYRTASEAGDDPTNRDWIKWQIENCSPEVCQHFVMISV